MNRPKAVIPLYVSSPKRTIRRSQSLGISRVKFTLIGYLFQIQTGKIGRITPTKNVEQPEAVS